MAAPGSGSGKKRNNLIIFWNNIVELGIDKVVHMFYTVQRNIVQTFYFD